MSLKSQRRPHLTAIVCLEGVRLGHFALGAGSTISDIHKEVNGLYTPFGSPVIGGQNPHKRMALRLEQAYCTTQDAVGIR